MHTLNTHSAMYSIGVQLLKSASGMNFLFIGVSKVTLEHDIVTGLSQKISGTTAQETATRGATRHLKLCSWLTPKVWKQAYFWSISYHDMERISRPVIIRKLTMKEHVIHNFAMTLTSIYLFIYLISFQVSNHDRHFFFPPAPESSLALPLFLKRQLTWCS